MRDDPRFKDLVKEFLRYDDAKMTTICAET